MKRFAIAVAVLLFAVVVAIVLFRQRPIAADISPNESIEVGGTTRNYRLVVPHTLTKPAPIVFAFHGIGDSPESMANYSRLDRLASENGFILVYPTARRSMWATVDADAEKIGTNVDVQFFDQLLAHLTQHHEIDRSRVYGVGMSNGASFVQLLAVARPDVFAAIVAQAGLKPGNIGSLRKSLPVMLLVGANDPGLAAIRSDADEYRKQGHDVEFVSVPGVGHAWSPRQNAEIWQFLSQHKLPAPH